MNELAAVQGNQGVNQASSGGKSRKSEGKSDSGVDFGAILSKATESKPDNNDKNTVRTENKSDGDRGVRRNKDKSDDDNVVEKKKDEKETPEEYIAANSSQGTNTTTESTSKEEESSSTEEVSATESVSSTESSQATDSGLLTDIESDVVNEALQTITEGDADKTEEVTVSEDAANKFKEHLKDYSKGVENGHHAHAIHGEGHGKGKGDKVKDNREIEGTESGEEINSTVTMPETGETEVTQENKPVQEIVKPNVPAGGLSVSPMLIQIPDFNKATTLNETQQTEIINMEAELISKFPEHEETIDEMTKDFLARTPNPTTTEFATFLESVGSAIEQIIAKDNEIAELNDKIDTLKTDLNAAASQISTLKQTAGGITVQQTLSDLSTNLQRMFAEIAASAQMTSPGTTSQLVLQLYPEHLGKLRIELTADMDGKITAKMQSANAAVRALLDSGVRDLIDCLKASGVDLKSLEVGKLEFELSNSDLGHRSNLQQNNQQNQQNQQNSRQNQSSITRVMAANPRILTSALYNAAVANSYVDENVSVEFTA